MPEQGDVVENDAPPVRDPLPPLRNFAQQALHFTRPDRLYQMMIEPRFLGEPSVGVAAVTGQGDERQVLKGGSATQAFRHFVSVKPWQPDVQQHHVGAIFRCGL